MSHPIASKRLAVQGFLWMMLGAIVGFTGWGLSVSRTQNPTIVVIVLSIGYLLIATAYALIGESLERSTAEYHTARKYLWWGACLQVLALAIVGGSYASGFLPGSERYFEGLPPIANCLSLLTLAGYIKFHAIVYPEISNRVWASRIGRIHALAAFIAVVAVVLWLTTSAGLFQMGPTVAALATYLLWLVLPLMMLEELFKLTHPASLEMHESAARTLRGAGVVKVVLGLAGAATCVWVAIRYWDSWSGNGEVYLNSFLLALISAFGLRWLWTGFHDVRLTKSSQAKSWLAMPGFILAPWLVMFTGGGIFHLDLEQSTVVDSEIATDAPGVAWKIDGKVECLAFSPNGRKIATLVPNQRIDIWNRDSRSLERSIVGNVGNSDLVFGLNGEWLGAINKDHSAVQLWNSETGETIRTFEKPGLRLQCFAVSHNGNWLASCHGDRSIVYVWEQATGRRIRVLSSDQTIKCVVFSPTDHRLVLGSWGNAIYQLDVTAIIKQLSQASGDDLEGTFEAEQLALGIGGSPIGSTEHVAFSKDGRWMYSACNDDPVRVWSHEPFQTIATLEEYRLGVNDLATDQLNRWLLVVPFDEVPLDLWDSQGKRKLRSLEGHRGRVRCAAFSPDGLVIASSGDDQTVRLWNAETGESLD